MIIKKIRALFIFGTSFLLGSTSFGVQFSDLKPEEKEICKQFNMGVWPIISEMGMLAGNVHSSAFAPDILQFSTLDAWLDPQIITIISRMKYGPIATEKHEASPTRITTVEKLRPQIDLFFSKLRKELQPVEDIIITLRKDFASTDALDLDKEEKDKIKDDYAEAAGRKINEFEQIIRNDPEFKKNMELDSMANLLFGSLVEASASSSSIATLLEQQTLLQHFGEKNLENWLVDKNSPLIRRPLHVYEAQYKEHKLLLCAGHHGGFQFGVGEGKDMFNYGFSQDMSWYAVDTCEQGECAPDALLNIQNREDLSYFPDKWADKIYVDDYRFMNEATYSSIHRILKKGARFFRSLGIQATIDSNAYYKNSDNPDAEYGFLLCSYRQIVFKDRKTYAEWCHKENPSLQQKIMSRSNELARHEYAKYQFSSIEVININGNGLMIFTK
ncbi:MAG: hypothetical protein A2007_06270 [Verrucomicrobia bacterium GWC2_42_7]|nr:MAG: hypothetical protein A2007_06270 [Verrucomicrobia bacterium GWC2_42_7]